LDFFWHLPPTTPGVAIQPFFEATDHRKTDLSRARAPEPRGGSAAAPGRRLPGPPGGCRRLGLHLGVPPESRFREAPKAEGKNPSKNDIKKQPKIGEPWLLDRKFGLFVWQIVKEAFKFSDSLVCVPVVCCFDVIFGVQNVPFGMWRRCVYQTWGKRLY